MKRHAAKFWLAISATVMLLASGCQEADNGSADTSSTQSAKQPNIVFILMDDVGFGDVSMNGSEIDTPNIDGLAAGGVKLDRSYVYPICSPTRAALLTGQNPFKFGVDGPMSIKAALQLDLTLLPEHLKRGGYDTWLVGKWHLGHRYAASRPTARGFDYFYGLMGGFVDHYTHVQAGGVDWQRNGETIREEGHTTQLLTNDAIRLIKGRDQDKPFFLYMAYDAPHTPLQYIDGVERTYPEIEDIHRRVYAEMLTDLDKHIGILVASLEEEGILEDTLIVLLSDNGGAKQLGSTNKPLRGDKGQALEGGLRTPGAVYWRGTLEGGKVLEEPIFIQNWAPTLLQLAGVDISGAGFDGSSHWSIITGKDTASSQALVALGGPDSRAVFAWPHKYLRHTPRGPGPKTVVTALYNVAEDPTETTDLIGEKPELATKLATYLTQFDGKTSLREKGPRPESYFNGPDGKPNYNLRLQETKAPWAEDFDEEE